MLEDVLDVPRRRRRPPPRPSHRPPARASSSASIASSSVVRELVALGVEELDPVVLRRVVRGGEHDAEILGEQRDGGCRQHTTENGDPARRRRSPARAPPRAPARSHACRGRRRRARAAPTPSRRGRAARRGRASACRRRCRARHRFRSEVRGMSVCRWTAEADAGRARQVPRPYGRRVIAWRTAVPCAPCAGRPSCARPDGRRA